MKSPPLSPEARIEAGFLLRRLQQGATLALPQSRPIPDIGKQCHDLRINDRDQSWRIVHHVADDAAVVPDVFSQKTQTTPKSVIRIDWQVTRVSGSHRTLSRDGWPDFVLCLSR
ncbi:MAG: hypothetical protein Q8L86_06395 [Vicinamibacterales bacterium]|nr:hypothetical protein [Vicinamibacterales bacterium]